MNNWHLRVTQWETIYVNPSRLQKFVTSVLQIHHGFVNQIHNDLYNFI